MGQVDSRVWVDGDGFEAAGLVQIGDGSVEEERRDGEAARRETQRKENETQKEQNIKK